TPRRTATTVPQQALFAMNSSFVLARSRALASLVQTSGSRDETAKDVTVTDIALEEVTEEVVELYRRVHGRRPRPEELTLASEFVNSATLEQLAQVLLMSNELLFVD
ncbi:MAG: DUF1553 domain-containing protein, partial [Pirellulaceae bacterium]|nr:DUF1553 domain-containing protein [Pirellulaceae bacterium]